MGSRRSKKHYRDTHEDVCEWSESTSTVPPSTTTTQTSTSSEVSPIPQDPTESPIQLRKKCRNISFRKNNRDICKEALDKCKNRIFRVNNEDKCRSEEGDKNWLEKKCLDKKFFAKYETIYNNSPQENSETKKKMST